jgi:hypothetical protein
MEFKYSNDCIKIKDKNLSELDNFVRIFIPILEKHVKYVIVSGYVAILFGRNRTSEDVDIIIEKPDFEVFKKLWNEIYMNFECLNTSTPENAYNNYLVDNTPIRFSKKNEFIPNIEIKFPKIELDKWTLFERKKVVVNDYTLYVSPLELEIPYKLYLGSHKDIEDARFLYGLFKKHLDIKLINEFNQKLKTNELFIRYIK